MPWGICNFRQEFEIIILQKQIKSKEKKVILFSSIDLISKANSTQHTRWARSLKNSP